MGNWSGGAVSEIPAIVFISTLSVCAKSQPHKQHIWFLPTHEPTRKKLKLRFSGPISLLDSTKQMTPRRSASSVENLPIKLANTKTQEKIETRVDQLLAKKMQEHSADAMEMGNKIDIVIHKHYELPEEEIKIVRGNR